MSCFSRFVRFDIQVLAARMTCSTQLRFRFEDACLVVKVCVTICFHFRDHVRNHWSMLVKLALETIVSYCKHVTLIVRLLRSNERIAHLLRRPILVFTSTLPWSLAVNSWSSFFGIRGGHARLCAWIGLWRILSSLNLENPKLATQTFSLGYFPEIMSPFYFVQQWTHCTIAQALLQFFYFGIRFVYVSFPHGTSSVWIGLLINPKFA